MSSPPDPRIDAILEVLLAFSRQDFRQKVPIGERLDSVDAIAAGLNMLAEELDGAVASRRELEAAYRSLQDAQARLVHGGKLAAIGQLASGVAHEVNNPAAWVMLSLSVFGRQLAQMRSLLAGAPAPSPLTASLGALVEQAEQVLSDATEGITRIRTVTNDLRTFSRSDGELTEPLCLDEVVRSACALAAPVLRGTVALELRLCGQATVVGNRGRLGQVVTNLLVNAVQAVSGAEPARRRVRISSLREGAEAVLAVEDGGTGVPAELRTRVFDPFFTTKSADAGTGLGLSLVAEIVLRHQGTVQVLDSELGGARFEVRLPAAATASAGPGEPTGLPLAPGPQVPASAARARLLIVDDEPRLLKTFALVLEPEHEVCLADGGRAALARLETERDFDLILCDLQMPEVDGVDVYERVLAFAPELAGRFVFSTGGVFQARARQFLARVGPPLLEKPVREDELRALIARHRAPAR